MATKMIQGGQTDDVESVMAESDENEEDIKAALAKSIKVDVSDAGVLRKTLRITVPRDHISTELDREYKNIITEAVVPGFRRGRAPRRLVEKRYGGEVGSQVQTRLVSNGYLAAIEKENLKVLGDPLVWVKMKDREAGETDAKDRLTDMPTALKHMKLPDDGDLEIRCEVEVKPEFELPKLDGVTVQKPDLTISDEDVTVQIDRMRAQKGNWAPVSGGKVEADDLLVCDVVMTVGGKEVKKTENMQVAARAQRIEGMTFEDLGDKLKGAKAGDTGEVEGELPDDYEVEDLRGKKAKLQIKINDIKRLSLPPLDKAYLESQGFESEKEYRGWVKQQMEGRLEFEVKRGMREQIRKYLLDETKLELPEGLSSRQTDRAILRKAIELKRMGVPDAEIEKHADELRTSAKEEATAALKLHFILEEIAEKHEVEVTEEEINGQIAEMARAYNRRFDRVRDELARSNGIESLYLQIRDDKCIDRILEKATITKADLEKKAPGKKQAKPEPTKEKEEEPAKAPKTKAKEEKPKETKKPAAPKKKS